MGKPGSDGVRRSLPVIGAGAAATDCGGGGGGCGGAVASGGDLGPGISRRDMLRLLGMGVAGLIFDKRSEVMAELFAPCLHFVSYYQVEKGGVVQFAYTGFPHWPAQYLPGQFPPPGKMPRLRWEWTPERVPLAELFPWYDYVLTRGDGFRPPPGTFHAAWHGNRWTVWARDGS